MKALWWIDGDAHETTSPSSVSRRSGKTWDLSKIDFEKLKEDFKASSHKNIEIADLRAFIQKKLEQMLKQNATRTDFATRLQGIIDRLQRQAVHRRTTISMNS